MKSVDFHAVQIAREAFSSLLVLQPLTSFGALLTAEAQEKMDREYRSKFAFVFGNATDTELELVSDDRSFFPSHVFHKLLMRV